MIYHLDLTTGQTPPQMDVYPMDLPRVFIFVLENLLVFLNITDLALLVTKTFGRIVPNEPINHSINRLVNY